MIKGMALMFVVMILSLVVAGMWNSVPIIKDSVHAILDPTAGSILNFNKYLGMFVVIFVIALITTIIQKYGTDQASLKKLKEEQKILQEESKKYKNDPGKLMELNKKQLEFVPKTFDLTMKPLIFTFIPFVLFFRWFSDYFMITENSGFKFFGFLSWFWFYFIFTIIFSSVLRKVMKVH